MAGHMCRKACKLRKFLPSPAEFGTYTFKLHSCDQAPGDTGRVR